MFMLNNQPISIDNPFTAQDGTRYPNLRDPAIRAKVGVIEVADPEQYDQRFYWGVGNPKLLNDREEVDEQGNPVWVQVLGTVDGEPAMVDSDKRLVTKGLKSQWIAQVKDTAGKMLSATDWMIIRKIERGVELPTNIQAFRTAVLAEANRLEAAIAGCADVEALIAVVATQQWPTNE
jgi:hypothetical protein